MWLSHHSIRHAPFEERVAAAAAAGIEGVGLNIRAYRAMQAQGWTDRDMQAVLARHQQRLTEIEVVAGWAQHGDIRRRALAAEETAHHLAAVFGACYLQVIGPYDGTIDDAAEAFAGVCDRAANEGLTVGLEFLPFTNIAAITTALDIVERSDRPNGGLCVDSWHFFRGDRDWDALAGLPGGRVASVQINDGPLQPEHPDYLEDCLLHRRVPGAGEFDLTRFIRVLDSTGSTAPIAIEVISADLDRLDPSDAVLRMAEATRTLLRTARRPS
jgi:sugar phosphate isomerase/epimerase